MKTGNLANFIHRTTDLIAALQAAHPAKPVIGHVTLYLDWLAMASAAHRLPLKREQALFLRHNLSLYTSFQRTHDSLLTTTVAALGSVIQEVSP